MSPLIIKGIGIVLTAVGGFILDNASNLAKKTAKTKKK